MRVAVVDIGSNSTRLLVADVDKEGRVIERVRRSQVTRLGSGVDAHGELAEDAMQRVLATLDEYRRQIDECGCDASLAVLTSAVRDAANGPAFTTRVRDDYHLDAQTLSGDEEAQLTFLGATSEREEAGREPTVVIDIGGGSTEFVVGVGDTATFHVSTQAGVVRMSERHLRSDLPTAEELAALADDVRSVFADAIPANQRGRPEVAIAVAGTATSAAAIDLALVPYDPEKVHGYHLSLERIHSLRDRMAALTEAQRRHVPGLHPDRAPTIVAGLVMLGEAIEAFGLGEVEVSEHDILRGGALRLAGRG